MRPEITVECPLCALYVLRVKRRIDEYYILKAYHLPYAQVEQGQSGQNHPPSESSSFLLSSLSTSSASQNSSLSVHSAS